MVKECQVPIDSYGGCKSCIVACAEIVFGQWMICFTCRLVATINALNLIAKEWILGEGPLVLGSWFLRESNLSLILMPLILIL